MSTLLRDLYGHQAWADAEHWRAIGGHPPASADRAIRDRLHHIHFVQHAFLWCVGDRAEAFGATAPENFQSLDDLKAYARAYHNQAVAFVAGVSEARLDERIMMPWFKDPPLSISIAEALTQCAMHSQHHRGQNATRLRELKGEPPMTDLIVWYWKGRPAPEW
jgi:uncharacterized damage-inducible protein DinB